VLTEKAFREEPVLTQSAFNRLLQWLDDGDESHGERYLEMRRRLVAYFERRDCLDPDGLADETFNRIGRTLEEQGVILTRPPAKYCYVIARFVMLEDLRRQRKHVQLHESTASAALPGAREPGVNRDDSKVIRERRFRCLDHCLEELRPDQRQLAIDYYRETGREKIERRRDLAKRLGVSMNALGIRVCRIRDTLQACMERCSGTATDFNGFFLSRNASATVPRPQRERK